MRPNTGPGGACRTANKRGETPTDTRNGCVSARKTLTIGLGSGFLAAERTPMPKSRPTDIREGNNRKITPPATQVADFPSTEFRCARNCQHFPKHHGR